MSRGRKKKHSNAAEKQRAYRQKRNAKTVTKLILDLLNGLPEEMRFKVWFVVRDELYRAYRKF